METNNNNGGYKPHRRPARKLNFGAMLGMRTGDSGEEQSPALRRAARQVSGEDNDATIRKYAPLMILVLGVVLIFDLFFQRDVEVTNFNSEDAITEMTWNGTITKKYFAKNSEGQLHLLYEIKNKDGKTQIVDFYNETSGFWDKLDPYATISKPANSTKVHARTYAGTEANFELKFED